MDDDRTLIRAYLHGSERAFEELYYRYRQPLYSYLCSMLPPADADDVFQKTWIRVCSVLSSYRDQGKFQAWLFRIGRNLAWNHIRSWKYREEHETDPGKLDFCILDPQKKREDEELCRMIDRVLETLPEHQKAVFQMRREGHSFRLIAEVQKCERNTAVKRMQRAIGKIREIIQNLYGG